MHNLAPWELACLAVEVDAAQHFGRLGASLEGREREGRHQLRGAGLEVRLLQDLRLCVLRHAPAFCHLCRLHHEDSTTLRSRTPPGPRRSQRYARKQTDLRHAGAAWVARLYKIQVGLATQW